MAPHFFNTLSGRIEDFHPLHPGEVRMYACGPTVYDFGHIGNFRTFVHVDLLRRFLESQGIAVKHVMNITDVDDKIIRNAAKAGVSINDYTAKYTKAFLEDAESLNIEKPEIVRATEHIEEMAKFIQKLVDQGIAYKTEDGSYYFRIAKFMHLLRTRAEVKDGKVDASGRLYGIDNISFSSGDKGLITATLALDAFVNGAVAPAPVSTSTTTGS